MEGEAGSFTFNYSIAHCVGDGGGKEEERKMKRGKEPDSCFKVANSSENGYTDLDTHIYSLHRRLRTAGRMTRTHIQTHAPGKKILLREGG